MTIDEAIESIEDDLEDNPLLPGCRLERAKRLGIEALHRCNEIRKYTPPGGYMPLPGETK